MGDVLVELRRPAGIVLVGNVLDALANHAHVIVAVEPGGMVIADKAKNGVRPFRLDPDDQHVRKQVVVDGV